MFKCKLAQKANMDLSLVVVKKSTAGVRKFNTAARLSKNLVELFGSQ